MNTGKSDFGSFGSSDQDTGCRGDSALSGKKGWVEVPSRDPLSTKSVRHVSGSSWNFRQRSGIGWQSSLQHQREIRLGSDPLPALYGVVVVAGDGDGQFGSALCRSNSNRHRRLLRSLTWGTAVALI
jgi:hypothetical protein